MAASGRARPAGDAAFRFAPSPNGRLHLGHAYSALLNDGLARDAGGRFLVRIEDIDPGRTRESFVEAIFEDLAWLGLRWEEPVRRQSAHMPDYAAAADRLRERALLYPCFCTRNEVARAAEAAAGSGEVVRRDPDGAPLYPGTCRRLPDAERTARFGEGPPASWRLDMAAALLATAEPISWTRFDEAGAESIVSADPARWGDPVIVRRDTPTSYHLAVVVDDAIQEITDVVRGLDLEAATDLHALLQRLLGLPTPRYLHHALVRDAVGLKLSKSAGSPALADLRRDGTTAEEVRKRLGFEP